MKKFILVSIVGITCLCATVYYAIEHEAFYYELKWCSDGELSSFKKSLYKSDLWNWIIPENENSRGRPVTVD